MTNTQTVVIITLVSRILASNTRNFATEIFRGWFSILLLRMEKYSLMGLVIGL